MALPTCECIKGKTQAEKLDAIYCALLAISTGQGITITASQISDATPLGIAFLQKATPASDTVVAITTSNTVTNLNGVTQEVDASATPLLQVEYGLITGANPP